MESIVQNARKILENEIIRSANQIEWPKTNECFDQDALYEFGHSWNELSIYYKNVDDLDIGVIVVASYLEYVDYFFRVSRSDIYSQDCKEAAEEAQVELMANMQSIISTIERRLYPNGR